MWHFNMLTLGYVMILTITGGLDDLHSHIKVYYIEKLHMPSFETQGIAVAPGNFWVLVTNIIGNNS